MADLPTNLQTLQDNAADIALAVDGIATAISGKGGTLPANPGLMDFPGAINSIPGASTLGTKSIVANGTYQAESDNLDGYSSVSVAVPNSYAAGDEGKVVSSGALVAQTAYPSTVTANDTYDTTNYNSITVNVSGGGGDVNKPVKFHDYDGSVVYSYTPEEFAELTEWPTNPSHEGLTAQGWNWDTLANAKTYVASYGKLDIGQMYVTSDGKTRIYINLSEGRISPVLMLYLNANTELDIDWGDSSTHSTFTSTTADYKSERHNYPDKGEYVIVITVVNGSFILQSQSASYNTFFTDGRNNNSSSDRAYLNSIQKIEIGTGISQIRTSAFYNCYSLSSVTIPNSVTSIVESAFNDGRALSSITFESTTPPELYEYYTVNIPYACIIRVPQGSLSAYTSAENYPDPSQYIYEEY